MTQKLDKKAIFNGAMASILLVIAIYFGSGRLRNFDPALVAYTSAVIFATFGIVYRYSIWLQKPPTRLYWQRGWQLFLRPSRLPKNILSLARIVFANFVLQLFIKRRGNLRWMAHFLMSWGCILAFAVTFPLVFGWIHFEASPTDPAMYQAVLLGFSAGTFPANSMVGWVTFHILDFCAVAIILGMGMSFRRRMYDKGAMSVQSFSMDFLPLVMLFSVCVTGLMLTANAIWMHGQSYSFIAVLHAFSVIVLLLYLPFGKFFHIFQRPANLGVQYYKQESAESDQATCKRCNEAYASVMHIEDLKKVLGELGLDQRFEDGAHYQDICPACRRRNLALTQLDAIGGPGFL